jgi:hypothetical protein
LYQLYEGPDTVKVVKAGRLRWLGHLFRSEDMNPCRKLILKSLKISEEEADPP